MTELQVHMRRAESLREVLENDIVTGTYPAGTRLDEVMLATRFNVSRTPIREALIELSGAGLVEIRPRRGAFVREIGITRLIEMFEVMADLEAMCGRLAARRIRVEELAGLEQAHEACIHAKADGDPDAYFHANQAFHEAIYKASHNSFLEEQALLLQNRLKVYRRLQLRVPNRISGSLSEHGQIVEAIKAGDSQRAAEALRQHVLIQGERFNDFVASVAGHVKSGSSRS
ncbi:GntR family transcriptional regulator [Roseibium litorale]|uniref:GntR family transcriptional regulator n=1 Tax=Roseibium litorale TaxID=2803841 RepID=A0ABR9CQR4_9HYPH|nr:GntR family transcriptional regulator [Roseibium litorale]MBD8893207.1 GntR family transcriptional regulator [Roseibium litorale]